MLIIEPDIRIPHDEFEFTYVRSAGPGGQNVNKVNTKAVLRWPATASPSITGGVRARFMAKFGKRLTTAGEMLITSQRFRDQGRNKDDCLEKLREMLASIAVAPKRRKKTKPTRASQERRLDDKLRRSQHKQGRRRPADE